MPSTNLEIIGHTELVEVSGIRGVPAKTDTGADSSSIWASRVKESGGKLKCVLFAPNSRYYNGKLMVFDKNSYQQTRVASSSGHRQARYAVWLPMKISGRTLQVRLSLANRDTMLYPILLGCDVLAGRFLVDARKDIPTELLEDLRNTKRQRAKQSRAEKVKQDQKQ